MEWYAPEGRLGVRRLDAALNARSKLPHSKGFPLPHPHMAF